MIQRTNRLLRNKSASHRADSNELAEMDELQRFQQVARILAIGLLRYEKQCRSLERCPAPVPANNSSKLSPSRLEVSPSIGLTVTNPVNCAGESEPQEQRR